METKEWLIIAGLVLTLCTTLYAIASKWIDAWKEIEKERNREHIEAVVDLRFETKLDEMKKNYAEMIQLLKTGTFK